jgi:outer membrane protein
MGECRSGAVNRRAGPACARKSKPYHIGMQRPSARGWCLLVLATLVLGALAVPAAAQRPGEGTLAVGVVLDGPSPLSDSVRAGFEREVRSFFGTAARIEFPAELRLAADWTARGTDAALDRLFADPRVGLVLALGPVGSNQLARRRQVPKPAIAAVVVDAAVQGLPVKDGATGVKNLTFVDASYTTARTLEVFRQVVPYRHLVVMVDPGIPAAMPSVAERLRSQAGALGASVVIVPVTGSVEQALQALPAEADAVYLGPVDQLGAAGIDSLIRGLTARRLPTLSITPTADVGQGVMAAYIPRDDLARRARRVAVDIQRILGGEDAGTLPVSLLSVARLTINMATARAIGFSPGWAVLTEAELVNEEAPSTGPVWSLAAAGREAVAANLDLRAADQAVAVGRQETRLNRAPLLPQLQAAANATFTRYATAAASFGQQAQRQSAASLSFSQTLYDDDQWASYRISRYSQDGRVADRRRTELEAVLRATTAYLNVLRTRALSRVERENLALTRSNLEVAELKERTGAGGLSDVYRWRAELAQSRRSVLDADANARVAALELNAALNHPLEESFRTADAAVDDPALLLSQPRLLDYFGSPATFDVFRDFMVEEGLAAAPEIQALDAQIQAQQREGTAARRSFFLPVFTLQGSLSSVLSRGGAGSTPPSIGGMPLSTAPDATWSLRLQASIPVFSGMAQSARLGRATLETDRLTLARQSAALGVSQQIRGALQVASASWANITQAREAAEASSRNLEIVTDAYGRGAVNVITLLDAQQSALSANEAAANAVYGFLIDLMNVQRAAGRFDFFESPEDRDAFFQRLDAFYQARGVAPVQH